MCTEIRGGHYITEWSSASGAGKKTRIKKKKKKGDPRMGNFV